ncbi:Outer membrane protein porin [Paraburkholderia caribensis MBA4]|uniref:Outer membrane protein porin n=1 Tax=Paraburkholderia caribensis MBA4 TaxID=1323664 RepID=A0A0P0RAV2_9BURK|nr:porin [Paraburkholderia caribensis]ALL65376.1 Outer membrane protein porin [Paraburkholderia caribensis MBA4]
MPTSVTSRRLPRPEPLPPSRRRAVALVAVCRLLALACLSVIASPSRAQGSVTLYGLIDTSIEVTNPGSGYVARMDSGAYRGTRFGLHGSEPLGDGNSLVFTLENGFDSASGAFSVPGSLFNRQAWIGAHGAWGELRAGRQYSPLYIPFKGQLDAFGAGTIASGLNNLSKITPYTDNAFAYLSPVIAGFSATGMVALRDPGDDGNGIGGYYVTVEWALGGMKLLYAHQQTHGDGALRANFAGASYQWGALTGFVAYFNGDGGTPRYHDDGLSISALWQITPQASASVGYAHARDRSGGDNDADQFSIAFDYQVSKALLLYLSAADLENRGQATFTLRGVNVTGIPVAYPGAPVRGVQIGMIERF